MDPIIFFSVLLTIYLVAFFFDCFFKSCMHYPYDAFLRNTGLTVQFLRLKWYTTAFNRSIFRWGTACKRLLIPSFNCGVAVAFCLLPLGIILLFMTLFNGQSNSSTTKLTDTKIEILLPGVNLPLDEIGFYIATLLVSTVFHELGHALAAVIDEIPVTGFGFQIFFCIPIAYTEISTEHFNSVHWMKKLRILCGGIWHNIILSFVCYLCFCSLGIITSPFYTVNESVIVIEIKHNSLLRGEKGIQEKDIVMAINDCRVQDVDTWFDCLLKSIRTKPGFCVSSDFIRVNDESVQLNHGHDGVLQCCDVTNPKQCCFEYIDDISNEEPVEIPQHVCLDVRKTIEDAYGFCSGTCEKGFCMRPLLNNATTIINMKRRNKSDVIYIGHPSDISRTIRVSPYVPKTKLLTPQIADTILLFLKYNIVFSMGLAVINIIPCFGLDGQHIAGTIINSFLVNRITERAKREIIVLLVTGMGTVLFVLAILKVIWVSILSKIF